MAQPKKTWNQTTLVFTSCFQASIKDSIINIMIKKHTLLTLTAALACTAAFAQLGAEKETFTRADSLRGYMSPLRTCYDINYYHLDVKFDIPNKFISGNVLFKFTATTDFTKLQFDLFSNLKVEKVVYKGKELPFTREFNAVFT